MKMYWCERINETVVGENPCAYCMSSDDHRACRDDLLACRCDFLQKDISLPDLCEGWGSNYCEKCKFFIIND